MSNIFNPRLLETLVDVITDLDNVNRRDILYKSVHS